MEKRKKRTGKPGRVVIEVKGTEEITFEAFERTMKKLVKAKLPKTDSSKDKGGNH